MAIYETEKRPIITETGPKPLTPSGVEYIAKCLLNCRLAIPKGESKQFARDGMVFVTEDGLSDMSRINEVPYIETLWTKELLKYNPIRHSLRKCGENLEVYKTSSEFISEDMKPKAIIKARDFRFIDKYPEEGIVSPSGFVLLDNFQLYPDGQMATPEDLEQAFKKNNNPRPFYHRWEGFAKVDPSFSGKRVKLITFSNRQVDMKMDGPELDAVVIDLATNRLLPRAFYRLNPEAAAH